MQAVKSLAGLERPVSDYVPYSHHVTPTIIATRNAEYLSVWRLGGRTFEGKSIEAQMLWVDDLNNTLRTLANKGIAFWSHVVRRRVELVEASTSFTSGFCRRFDERYRATFENSLTNELYLTVLVQPSTDPTLRIMAKFERRTAEALAAWQATAIDTLDDLNRSLAGSLHRYDPELLGTYEHNGFVFSAAAEALGLLLNGEHHRVPLLPDHLWSYLPRVRPLFSRWGEIGELRGTRKTKRFGLLELYKYPEESRPGHLNELLESPFEFVLTQSFSLAMKGEARERLKRHAQLMTDTGDDAVSQVDDLKLALDDLMSDRLVMGEHHATLCVWGDSAEAVRKHLAAASARLESVSVIPTLVDTALEAAWWAQLPGNWRWRPRPAMITSLNFLCFSSFHNYLSGKATGNPWGPAVMPLKTAGGVPYYVSFHGSLEEVDDTGQRRLGNTMVVGKSGTGKTALLAAMLTMAQKFQPTMAVFDKDRGLQKWILALGGRYFPLTLGKPTGWNPFVLADTPSHRAFLRQLIEHLATRTGEPLSSRQYDEVAQAVDQLMEYIDRPLRRLSTLRQFLPNPALTDDVVTGPTSVSDRLKRWCEGGEYGWILDNVTDGLDLEQTQIFGFDTTEFLELDAIRSVVNMYLLYRTERMIDGRRFIYVFDECQHPLKDHYFQDLAQNKSRTIRKQNGVFIFATQEPSAILSNPVGSSLTQQTATAFYLPNPDGKRTEYVEGFGLSDAEFETMRGFGEFSRKMLVKQGQNATVAQLDLHGFEELHIFSGAADQAQLVEFVMAEVGNDPDVWVPAYLERISAEESA